MLKFASAVSSLFHWLAEILQTLLPPDRLHYNITGMEIGQREIAIVCVVEESIHQLRCIGVIAVFRVSGSSAKTPTKPAIS